MREADPAAVCALLAWPRRKFGTAGGFMKIRLFAAAGLVLASVVTAHAQADAAPTGTLRAAYLATNPKAPALGRITDLTPKDWAPPAS